MRSCTAAIYSYPGAAIMQANTDGSLFFLTRDNAMQPGRNLDGTLTFGAGDAETIDAIYG